MGWAILKFTKTTNKMARCLAFQTEFDSSTGIIKMRCAFEPTGEEEFEPYNSDFFTNVDFSLSSIQLMEAIMSDIIFSFDNNTPDADLTVDDIKIVNFSMGQGIILNNGVSHSLDSAFQVSATRNAQVVYTVSITSELNLTTGEAGIIFLEMSPNGSTGWVEVGRFGNSNTGTLTLSVSTLTISGQLSSFVPAGNYLRLRTSAVAGTPVMTYITGQEAILG